MGRKKSLLREKHGKLGETWGHHKEKPRTLPIFSKKGECPQCAPPVETHVRQTAWGVCDDEKDADQ